MEKVAVFPVNVRKVFRMIEVHLVGGDQHHAPDIFKPPPSPRRRKLGIPRLRRSLNSTSGLDDLRQNKFSCPFRDSNPRCEVHFPVKIPTKLSWFVLHKAEFLFVKFRGGFVFLCY